MADIKPFFAVKPKRGMESDIAALPYDVYNRKEAKEVVSKNPLSFLKIDRAETSFDESVDTYDPRVYIKAKELYEEMKADGSFVRDEKEGFYLYEETMFSRSQTGLVCLASVSDYENNIIKKHENTRQDKEIDRINHVDTMNAQTGPIFLAYKDSEKLNCFFNKVKEGETYFDFTSEDGVRHRAWQINSDSDVAFIINCFKSIPDLYIADGHHRCASACKVSAKRRNGAGFEKDMECNHFLSVIFPESELMIMDYNRVVKDLNGLSCEELLNRISEYFEINEISVSDEKPSKKNDVFMFLEDKEYLLHIKEKYLSTDPIKSLDVSILQDYLLNPILGISDPKTDKRIDFVGGIRGVAELRRRITLDCKVAFAMYPTQMGELFKVADAGLLMPPKSTWFEPKLRSGLFIHEI